jgi:hypothetical protein
MKYRTFPKGGERISTVGIGGSELHAVSEKEMVKMVDFALESGFNIIDLATETVDAFPKVRKALEGRRDKFMLGLHLGLTFGEDGQYKRTREIDEVSRGLERQLAAPSKTSAWGAALVPGKRISTVAARQTSMKPCTGAAAHACWNAPTAVWNLTSKVKRCALIWKIVLAVDAAWVRVISTPFRLTMTLPTRC